MISHAASIRLFLQPWPTKVPSSHFFSYLGYHNLRMNGLHTRARNDPRKRSPFTEGGKQLTHYTQSLLSPDYLSSSFRDVVHRGLEGFASFVVFFFSFDFDSDLGPGLGQARDEMVYIFSSDNWQLRASFFSSPSSPSLGLLLFFVPRYRSCAMMHLIRSLSSRGR